MSNSIFTTTNAKKPKRSVYKGTHSLVTSTDVGKNTVIFCEPTVPGDTFKVNTELYMRFMALQSPAMCQMDAYIHYWFVPNRLVYDKWKLFITGGKNGTTDEVYPRLTFKGIQKVESGITIKFDSSSGNQHSSLTDKSLQKLKLLNDYLGIGSTADYLGMPVCDWVKGYSSPDEFSKFLPPTALEYDLLPFLVYYRIWCDFYRDENLSDIYNLAGEVVDEFEPIGSGIYDISDYWQWVETPRLGEDGEPVLDPDGVPYVDISVKPNLITEALRMRYRAWEKDYFTSALPWAQRGGDVVIPGTSGAGAIANLDITPKVEDDGSVPSVQGVLSGDVHIDTPKFTSANNPGSEFTPGYARDHRGALQMIAQSTGVDASSTDGLFSGLSGDHIRGDVSISSQDIAEKLQVVQSEVQDLQSAEGTINNLRRANALQKYLEAMARGGSRYIEQIKQIFGVTSSDSRLQRPEFLGGGKSPVVISEVLQQSASTIAPSGDEMPLGDFAGRAVSGTRTRSFKRFFEEHGWIIGILSIRPRSSYAGQGMPRKYFKFDRYDYANPYFANLGEQEIKNKEIFYQMSDLDGETQNEGTFGYAPRYAEYKDFPSRVSGQMRNNLAYWNLARVFDKLPNLNQEFVEVHPEDADRIFSVNYDMTSVSDENGIIYDIPLYYNDRLVCQLNFNIKSKRCLPRNSTPRL